MMKYIKYMIFTFILSGLIVSCDEDDNTGHSILVPTNPSITITPGTYPAAIEGSVGEIKIPIMMSETQIVDVAVHTSMIAGDATWGVDFTVTERVIIPKGSTTGEIVVTPLSDCDVEGTEVFTLQFGDERTANANITTATADFTLLNFEDSDLNVSAGWDVEFGGVNAANVIDFDIFVLDKDGAEVTGFAAATGASPEQFVLAGTLPDGDYEIYVDLWESNFPDPGAFGPIEFPITIVTEDICGTTTIGVTVVQQNGIITTDDAAGSVFPLVATITKVGTSYTVSN